jgi:hypothetical protein
MVSISLYWDRWVCTEHAKRLKSILIFTVVCVKIYWLRGMDSTKVHRLYRLLSIQNHSAVRHFIFPPLLFSLSVHFLRRSTMIPLGSHAILTSLAFRSVSHVRVIWSISIPWLSRICTWIYILIYTTVDGNPKCVSSKLVHLFVLSSGSYSQVVSRLRSWKTNNIYCRSSLVYSVNEDTMLVSQ